MKEIILKKKERFYGNLILVNAKYSYQEEEFPQELTTVKNNSKVVLKKKVGLMLNRLLDSLVAKEEIVFVSGWRSTKEQQQIYDTSLDKNGISFTKQYVALPGHSEHQTGLAIDLALKQEEIDFICPDFPYSGVCGEFRKRAAAFGFIERYPKEKEAITGISHEPWHFRYVGVPHAAIIQENGWCLEEYIQIIKSHLYGENPMIYKEKKTFEISYFPVSVDSQTTIVFPEDTSFEVSGNNVDGFVITSWREGKETDE